MKENQPDKMLSGKKYIAIIPARYASTRFPAKPLALLDGKPIIRHVYEKVSAVFERTVVATDDSRIEKAVEGFGGMAVMTSPDHKSGTDRCYEAYRKAGGEAEIIVNVQGDEPFIQASQLRSVCVCFDSEATDIATLVKPFSPDTPMCEIENPHSPKVVTDDKGYALYFSRSVIPYLRGTDYEDWPRHHTFLKHIGLYAYRARTLEVITALPQGELELCESLEQLRWLQAGLRIKVAQTQTETIGIDTPADLERAEAFLREKH